MKDRAALLALLAAVDDEAFAYLAVAMLPADLRRGAASIAGPVWPDGVGGFQEHGTIIEIRQRAKEWLEL